jgi:hypothetical protein
MSASTLPSVSLGSIIRATFESNSSTDIEVLTDAVFAAIDPADYGFYLRSAIGARLSSEMGSARAKATPNIRKGVSTKQSIIRDEYWPRFLQQRIFVGGRAIILADASPADLRSVADSRRNQAAELSFRAEQFETLAGLMEKSRVSRLEDLDPAAASTVLGRAA